MEHDRRSNKKKALLPSEDPSTLVAKDGRSYQTLQIAQIFARKYSSGEDQYRQGKKILDEYSVISYRRFLDCITDPDAKVRLRDYLILGGKLDPLKDEELAVQIRVELKEDDLLKLLTPHFNTLDLSRIHAARRYSTADQTTLNTLISCYYRLGSEFLGPRRHYRQETRVIPPLPLPELPEDIFSNELICNIFFEREKASVIPIFDRDAAECFRYLAEKRSLESHPLKRQFIDRLVTYFQNLQSFEVSGFKSFIIGGQKDMPEEERVDLFPFPSSHQKEYAYRFINKKIGRVDLLIGDTGTRKTGGAILAMAAAGAKSTLIVCPAGVRDHWEKEAREKHEDDINVIKITKLKELIELSNSSENLSASYMVISYSLLSYLEKRDDGISILRNVFSRLNIDSIIADEVHLAKESDSACTRVLCDASRLLPEEAPRIAMTATGVVNSPEDLDAPVVFLRPHQYKQLGEFTGALRNDPLLISSLLHGNELLTRWSKDEILGDKLPDIEYIDEPVPFSPFHQMLYDFVYNDSTIEDKRKRAILRQVSLEPLLMKRQYSPQRINEGIELLLQKKAATQTEREIEEINERIVAYKERLESVSNLVNQEEVWDLVNQAYERYLQWYVDDNANEPFDEDLLVKLGYGDLVLWAFFNLPNGVENLIADCNNDFLKADWVGLKGLYSTKYRRLREILEKVIPSGENKVAIFSGFYQTDISTSREEAEDEQLAQATLLDHLASWFGSDAIVKIDGTVSITSKRGKTAAREVSRLDWRLNPAKNLGLFTVRASRLGIDLTIPNTKENRKIKRTYIINLDHPDTHADRVQVIGRFDREWQSTPITSITMRTTNPEQPTILRYGYIDHGMAKVLDHKRMLSQMMLDGVPLTAEEERELRSNISNLTIELYPTTPQKYLTSTFFPAVRGRGYKKNMEFFGSKGFEEMTNAEFFAAFYPQNDETSLAGHNAKVASQIIRDYQAIKAEEGLIGSIGSAAGTLQRALSRPVVNLDMLTEILSVGLETQTIPGSYVAGVASQLPFQDRAFQITEASLMLHWTSNEGYPESERVRVLKELNRVTTEGGLVIFTLPHSYLTNEAFLDWGRVMEGYFGLRLSPHLPSGLVRASDFRTDPISWIFNLEKVSEPDTAGIANDISLIRNTLRLDFERVVDIIGTKSRRNGHNRTITWVPPLPHQEFEVLDPNTGEARKVNYRNPRSNTAGGLSKADILNEFSILSELGSEEFGFYRGLIKEARRRWGLDKKAAKELSLKAMSYWIEKGQEKSNSKRIWSELTEYLEMIKEEL